MKQVILTVSFLFLSTATAFSAEPSYLLFQIFIRGSKPGPEIISAFPPSDDVPTMVRGLVSSIGTTGTKDRKLGFTVGPLTLDQSDEEIQNLISSAFRTAKQFDAAVAFHIDDQMFWNKRKDLVDNKANLEWLDWSGTPNSGRRLDWSASPLKIAPQLCLNSAAVKKAVVARAKLIGGAVKTEVDALNAAGRGTLFAGIMAGWESQIGLDFATNKSLGYCALSNRGYSAKNPPKNHDAELTKVLHEFVELWAKELRGAGIEKDKIYGHIAFTPQGLREPEKLLTHAQSIGYAGPEVAFSEHYRAGFSTYPEESTFSEIHREIGKRGSPRWISAEGTNVVPNGFPGEATMETYLAKVFNHGGTIVNLFSWGIGGEAEKGKNLFRKATESEEAISAYRKFLQGKPLVEEKHSAGAFTLENFRKKIQRIQVEAPAWVQRTGRVTEMEPLTTKLDRLMKEQKLEEADKVANEVLGLVDGNKK